MHCLLIITKIEERDVCVCVYTVCVLSLHRIIFGRGTLVLTNVHVFLLNLFFYIFIFFNIGYSMFYMSEVYISL